MQNQRGYIDLDGFFAVMAVLAVFGLFGIFASFYWGLPAFWQMIKPWLHALTG